MTVLDFEPRPAMGINTNGGAVFLRLIDNSDNSLLTQYSGSVIEMSGFGQGFFNYISEQVQGPDGDFLAQEETNLRKVVSQMIVPNITRPFDAVFVRNVQKERTITVDVPKERKVGLFRKETYIDHETRTEKYVDTEEVTYKGWRIEHLTRKEIYDPNNYDELSIDYYLGEDGEFYTALYNNKDLNPVFYKSIYFTPIKLAKKFCNIFISAFSGVLGALDAIPMDPADPQRNIHITLDSEYVYNFPIQLDSSQDYPYNLFHGALGRCTELLDDGELKDRLRGFLNT